MQKSTNTILTVGVLSLSLPLLVAIVGYLNRPKRNISSSLATLTKNYPQVDISLLKAIAALMDSTKGIDKLLRSEIGFDTSVAGSTNASGDDQLKLDISCDECVFANLRKSQVFEIGASEETPSEEELGGIGFSIGFDPLDGSSVIGSNFSIGSIFGIFPGRGVLNRTGREQVCAAISCYGPRTTFIVALPQINVVREFTLVDGSQWACSKDNIQINKSKKVFMPGNLRAINEHKKYASLVRLWMSERYTLRYTGAMVAEVNYLLTKGGGIFSNVSSATSKAKLRLLYECAPIALIIETAGGKTVHEGDDKSVLDVQVDILDRRCGLAMGSALEVDLFRKVFF